MPIPPKQFTEYTTEADFVVYHLKFKTQVKQNLSCSKHDGGGKAQGINLLVEAVDLYCVCVCCPRKAVLATTHKAPNKESKWLLGHCIVFCLREVRSGAKARDLSFQS